jgi:type II secretory pathway pseudopilin PulG
MIPLTASPPQPRRRQAGFSILELMIVVFTIGVLSSLIGAAYIRNLKRSRTGEAAGHLQKMWVGAITYYEADHALDTGGMSAKQFPGDASSSTAKEASCCAPPLGANPSGRCPGNDPVYRSEPWVSLQFNIADQHLFIPVYSAPTPTSIQLEAWGDLDCDGIHSIFMRRASVNSGGDVGGYLTPAVLNELE